MGIGCPIQGASAVRLCRSVVKIDDETKVKISKWSKDMPYYLYASVWYLERHFVSWKLIERLSTVKKRLQRWWHVWWLYISVPIASFRSSIWNWANYLWSLQHRIDPINCGRHEGETLTSIVHSTTSSASLLSTSLFPLLSSLALSLTFHISSTRTLHFLSNATVPVDSLLCVPLPCLSSCVCLYPFRVRVVFSP